LSGVAGPARSGRIEGWSKAPFGTRLPAMLLVAIVGLAAVLREAAPFVFLGLLFAYLYTRRFGTRSTAIAAVLPAAAILVWRAIPQPLADATGGDCTNLLAPPAIWRILEAAIGLLALGALIWDRRETLGELGFRRGSRRVLLVALLALLIVAPIAVYAATVFGRADLGGIFFGSYRLDLSQPMALVPALVFAASNALAEELAYRGAMRSWLTPSLGVTGANLAQAVLFGLSHTGRDFVGVQGVIPVMVGMVVVGYVAGVIVRRTRSLSIPLAIHAAADIPIYLYWACQLA
jgi:membrane protease YdiL (CAAX protease family)